MIEKFRVIPLYEWRKTTLPYGEPGREYELYSRLKPEELEKILNELTTRYDRVVPMLEVNMSQVSHDDYYEPLTAIIVKLLSDDS